jgi:hypothetical protein
VRKPKPGVLLARHGDGGNGVAAAAFPGVGPVLADVLAQAQLTEPAAVGDVLSAAARPLGIGAVRIYLADIQQRHLYLLTRAAARPPEGLAVGVTLAGRAFQTSTIQRASTGAGGPGQLWVPLMNGAERLGVLECTVTDMGEATLGQCQALASLAGLIIAARGPCSDACARSQRSQPVALQAELVHALTVPATFATEKVSVAAVLEPAYEVGGDAFDYSLAGDRLHVAVFDAAGHDLAAGLVASVALAACRSTRRAGGSLADMAGHADRVIASQFAANRFATAVLCALDTATGEFTWIPCGHPPPLLLRGSNPATELGREPRLPLGIAGRAEAAPGAGHSGEPAGPYSEQLAAGDRILLYTDGMTDGREAGGVPFGVIRLAGFVTRCTAAGLPAAETLRRLARVISGYQGDRLSDDATAVLLEWQPRTQPAP